MSRKGETWNESETYRDAWTLRRVRRITTKGLFNQTPNYHTNIGFSADSEFLIFATRRERGSAVMRCHVASGDITQLTDAVDGVITGGSLCLAPRSGWAGYVADGALRAVNIHSLEERTLIAGAPADWQLGIPSFDCTEQSVVLPAFPRPPAHLGGNALEIWDHYTKHGGVWLKLLKVPLAGGSYRIVYEEAGCRSAHCPHSPTDPDLILLDRDFPPRFWGGSDGRTNRIWILDEATGRLTELPPQDKARFQVHCAWTWDGEGVVYHGKSAKSGHYIGVAARDGQTIREYAFYDAPHYGHVSVMAGRPAIILDGNLSNDLLLWLYYDRPEPRVEVIARHGTDWQALGGQFPHPHPLSDPTGRWISFNVGQRGRSDVHIVTV
jgi:hypothetical protein